MKESCPKIRRHHRLHGEAAEIEHCLICVKSSSIRCQDHDGLPYGIRALSELHFVLPELFFDPPPVFDVGTCSIPVDDGPVFVAQGLAAEQEPAILSVEATHACFNLTRLA